MKIFYPIFLIAFYCNSVRAQTVVVSGQCMTGLITLSPNGTIDGKPAYSGTGTVDGISGIQVNVYWLASDNLWVLDFDGQPYFQNSCTTSLPSPTGNADCAWTPVEGQSCTGGDPLTIDGLGTTLPITLINLTARTEKTQVMINWETAGETNNKGFEIQRSPDGINWNKIGFVAGNINSSVARAYQFSDLNPIAGKDFYRLRQVDLDGKPLLSKIVSVTFLKAGFYSLSGNTGNGVYRLNIETAAGRVELSVLDASGKRLMTNTTGAGLQTIDISKFPAGIYLLRIIEEGTGMFTEKLVKL